MKWNCEKQWSIDRPCRKNTTASKIDHKIDQVACYPHAGYLLHCTVEVHETLWNYCCCCFCVRGVFYSAPLWVQLLEITPMSVKDVIKSEKNRWSVAHFTLHFNTSILIFTPNLAVAQQSPSCHFQSHFPPQQLLFVAHQSHLATTNKTSQHTTSQLHKHNLTFARTNTYSDWSLTCALNSLA